MSKFFTIFVLPFIPTIMFAQFKPTRKGDFNAYIARSFRNKKGDKTSSVIVERLGLLSEIASAHPEADPREWVRQRAVELTRKEREENKTVSVKLSPARRVQPDRKRMYHAGDLFLQPYFHRLGIGGICREIDARSKYKFNLEDILAKLVYGRILFPDSKLSTWQSAQNFIEHPLFELEDIYRALSVLSRESDFIQSQLYRNSIAAKPRNTRVIYYDCSNYYFEIESDDAFRKYGQSKEHRPNPIVQLGLFMDADGLPLAFCVNPGNTPETQTMQPLEEKLADNFSLSDFVACTDGGLGSVDNRMYNMSEGRDYITVLSLKKMRPHLQDWATEADAEWHTKGHDEGFTLEEAARIFGKRFPDMVFYRDRWTIETYKGSNGKMRELEEHLIVTYSHKYALYQRKTRAEQIAHAQSKIDRGESCRPKSPNDCRRLIRTVSATAAGEPAENTISEIDWEKVYAEERFDGFYAYGTSLDDHPLDILRANSFRGEIEALFRVTKTNLDLRPIYLSRQDRIIGHFIICFIALLILKQLQQSLNQHHSVDSLCDTLRGIKMLYHDAYGYEPAFDRTDITDELQQNANILIDTEIVPKAAMRAILRQIKKS